MNNKRIESLDFIRALSVLMIIIFHYSIYVLIIHKVDINISRYIFPFFGGLGVSFFIIISGGGNVINSNDSRSALHFYRKRITAIYPQFYVAYCVTAFLLFLFAGNVVFHNEIGKIVYTLLGLDGFLSQRFSTYYLVGEWFLGFIMILYIFFPAIAFCYRKKSALTLITSIAISAITIHYNAQLCEMIPFWNKRDIWNPLARLPEFIFGMILFESIKDQKNKLIAIIYFISLIIIVAYTLHDRHDMVANEHRNIPLFAACAAFLTITFEYILRIVHGSHIIKFISKHSFLAFLYHHQILTLVTSKIPLPHDKLALVFYGIYVIAISFLLAYFTYGTSIKLQSYINALIDKISFWRTHNAPKN